jgi:hypothetical protein
VLILINMKSYWVFVLIRSKAQQTASKFLGSILAMISEVLILAHNSVSRKTDSSYLILDAFG